MNLHWIRTFRCGAGALLPFFLTSTFVLVAGDVVDADEQRANAQVELQLEGTSQAVAGEPLHFSGTLYDVSGYASLRPATGASCIVRLKEIERSPSAVDSIQYAVISDTPVRIEQRGRFRVDVPIPTRALVQPSLEFIVTRAGKTRSFEFSLSVAPGVALDVRTDRQRYEVGEVVHLWGRLHRRTTGGPVGSQRVRMLLQSPSGQLVFDEEKISEPSGVVSATWTVPAQADAGHYSLELSPVEVSGASASAAFQVSLRAPLQLLTDFRVEPEVVAPGAAFQLTATVTTPSGVPVAGAEVVASEQEVMMLTDEAGLARLTLRAPAHLDTDVATISVPMTIRHRAHGVVNAEASYLVSRVDYQVEAIGTNGVLVPETDSEVWVAVHDVKGRPLPEGSRVRVAGPGIRAGAELVADAHGIVRTAIRVRPEDASTSALCSGREGVILQVEVVDGPPNSGVRNAMAEVCARVSTKAQVSPRVASTVVLGSRLVVDLERRRGVGQVLVEVATNGRRIASAVTDRDRVEIELPREARGVLTIRATPVDSEPGNAALTAPSASVFGVGSCDASLIVPEARLAPTIQLAAERYRVRETASLRIQVNARALASRRAWAAVVTRDLAQHQGEVDFTLDGSLSLDGSALQAALREPLDCSEEPVREPPLTQGYWERPAQPASTLTWLRDPMLERERRLRRVLGAHLHQVELLLDEATREASLEEGVVIERGGRRDFHPNILRTLKERRGVAVLGQAEDEVTATDLFSQDRSFSYDVVARRIARRRLVKILGALLQLTDANNITASRMMNAEIPERWLSRALSLGLLSASDLRDPWGGVFALRPVAQPRLVISERAPSYELASAGPDGRFGSSDDVRDPFARVVSQGSPYAVMSGEDVLMLALSTVAPGGPALAALIRAFDERSLAEIDEETHSIVTAERSEGADQDSDSIADMEDLLAAPAPAAEAMEMVGGLRAYGTGAGGGGGSGRGAVVMRRPVSAAASRLREGMPATLSFLPSIELAAAGSVVTMPLQDALTTYRTEVVTWTSEGFLERTVATFRVDQPLSLDASVPEVVTSGDLLQLPVRVANHTDNAERLRIRVFAEDPTHAIADQSGVQVEPMASAVVWIPVRVGRSGRSALRFELLQGDSVVDAVQRPMEVLPDQRILSEQLWTWSRERQWNLDLPNAATVLDPVRFEWFPSMLAFGRFEGAESAMLALLERARNQDLTASSRASALTQLQSGFGAELGYAIGALWSDQAVSDEQIAEALRRLGSSGEVEPKAAIGLGLARGGRSSLQGPLDELVSRIREEYLRRGEDSPSSLAQTAAALAMLGQESDARAMLERVNRLSLQLGDEALLEEGQTRAVDVEGTALAGLAAAALQDRDAAASYLNHLMSWSTTSGIWSDEARFFASLATATLSSGARDESSSVRVNGRELEWQTSPAQTEQASTPALNDCQVEFSGDAFRFLSVRRRYAIPWEGNSRMQVHVSVTGQVGAVDQRSGLIVEVHNRGATTLRSPEARISLPAGAQVDESMRTVLQRLSGVAPIVDGRDLVVRFPSMAPGTRVRLPLRIRWTVGGALHGFGVVVRDVSRGTQGEAVLASRSWDVTLEGEEPAQSEAELAREQLPPIAPLQLHMVGGVR